VDTFFKLVAFEEQLLLRRRDLVSGSPTKSFGGNVFILEENMIN
jgi:hypothetical protein